MGYFARMDGHVDQRLLVPREDVIAALQKSFDDWQARLAALGEDEICARPAAGGWSLKDVLAHLNAWQQLSIARLEAALHGREPHYPDWISGGPEDEGMLEVYNQRIYERCASQGWPEVRTRWQNDFTHFLQLAALLSEEDLKAQGKYAWMEGYPLLAVLFGSLEHHNEHLAPASG